MGRGKTGQGTSGGKCPAGMAAEDAAWILSLMSMPYTGLVSSALVIELVWIKVDPWQLLGINTE